MNLNNLKHSLKLYSFDEKFHLMIKLYNSKKFPNSLMLSGKKGIGKFTLVKHFLNYIFDKSYNLETKEINETSEFYRQYLNNVTPNVIYLDGFELKNAKIDDIRHLKSTLLKSNMSGMSRFIILDDVELFNHNSLNALLKIIEEPNEKLFFSAKAIEGLKKTKHLKSMNKGRAQNINLPCNTVGSHLAKVSLNSTDPVLAIGNRYRMFSPREVARIQSFPEEFKLASLRQWNYIALGNY